MLFITFSKCRVKVASFVVQNEIRIEQGKKTIMTQEKQMMK